MDKKEFEELKNKFEKETYNKKFSKVFNYLSLIVTTITVLASLFFLTTKDFVGDNNNVDLRNKINNLKLELNNQKVINDKLKSNTVVAFDTSDYGKDLYKIKDQIENLNNIILEDPEKALTVPLLKVEIKNQKEQNDKELQSIKDDMTRIYDMNKWIIGLVFTMLVSLIALNLSNLYSKKQKE